MRMIYDKSGWWEYDVPIVLGQEDGLTVDYGSSMTKADRLPRLTFPQRYLYLVGAGAFREFVTEAIDVSYSCIDPRSASSWLDH